MKHWFMVVMAAITFGACYMTFEPEGEYQYITHTVQTGETVWCIAERLADCQCKPFNEFVYEIGATNNLQGKFIKPGDQLIIPLWTRAKKQGKAEW